MFYGKDTGKNLDGYTVRGTFKGELEDTKMMIASGRKISIEQILVKREYH